MLHQTSISTELSGVSLILESLLGVAVSPDPFKVGTVAGRCLLDLLAGEGCQSHPRCLAVLLSPLAGLMLV